MISPTSVRVNFVMRQPFFSVVLQSGFGQTLEHLTKGSHVESCRDVRLFAFLRRGNLGIFL